MKKLIEAKKMNIALLMLIALTSLITFNACKEDVDPKNPVNENTGDPNVDLHELLGDSPTCTFRFYTRVMNLPTPAIGPNPATDKPQIFHGFNANPSDGEWHSYRPNYLKLNGMDWPYDNGYQFLSSGEQGYIEDLDVVMEYKGSEFKWNMKNIPEIDWEFGIYDTIEIDRSKPFYIKYGGSCGATTTTFNFNGAGNFIRTETEDNGNIVVSPEILQKFPAGYVGIIVGISRHIYPDTKHNGGDVLIDIDNIQATGFVAKFK